MKTIFKTTLLLLGVATGMGTIASCSDDDLPAADGLFRPVINESDNITHGLDNQNNPYMIIKWDNYTTANQYQVKIEANDGTDSREVTTDTTFYRFDELQYDKEYNISLTAMNTQSSLQSKAFTLTTTSLDYPTSLATPGTTDIIDTQARITWQGGANYDKLEFYQDSNDSLVSDTLLTDDERDAQEFIIRNLKPKTTYRVVAYENNHYKGKKRFATVASEKYDGKVFDLRDLDASEGKNYITTDQIAADVADNPDKDITYVLQGGMDYKISGGTKIPATAGTVKFVTGLTLAGNANFISSGGFALNNGEEVGTLEFEKINFKSDKLNNEDYTMESNTDKGWGGRQVFNINGTKSTLKNMIFRSCTIQGYRAVVRAQSDGDNVQNIVMEDCVIDGIGDQGVFTTTNKDCDWLSISMKNCTVLNIVMLCDLRKTTNTLNFNIENCTFCYAPIETTANANTPLFRLGSGNVDLKVKKTLFGPSMATGTYSNDEFNHDSGGASIKTYTAGVVGSIFLGGSPANLDVQDSYKTNFAWHDRGTEESGPQIYPLEGLGELGISETELWSNPSKGIFNIIGRVSGVDLTNAGAARWR